MKLLITCQTCGKILSTVEKPDNFTNDDIAMYEASSFCMTVAGQSVDDNGNPIPVYDGNSNIQATLTQE